MKKILFIACFAMLLVFSMGSCVYAASTEMTAAELIATASNNTITLTEDVTLTSKLTVPADVKVIDLGGKTLNLKAGIVIKNSLVIKNGTITRDAAFTTGMMISVSGATTDFVLNGVTLTGKDLENKEVIVTSGDYGTALAVTEGSSVTLEDSKIVNHNSSATERGCIVRIWNVETVDVINSEVSNNTLGHNATFAVKSCGQFTFDADSVVKNNTAAEASGIHVEDTNATIAGTIEGNETTAENGAGLYTMLNASDKIVKIEETAVIRNNVAAGAGGGIYVTGPYTGALGNVVMLGGLITGNSAKGEPEDGTLRNGGGAGIYVARGTMEIQGGIIENNTSKSGIGDAILVSNGGKVGGELTITAGYVDGKVKVSETYGDLAVEGGIFTDDVSAYVDTTKLDVVEDKENGAFFVGTLRDVNVKADKGGKVTVSFDKAVEGQLIKVTATAKEGYKVGTITVKDAKGNKVEVVEGEFLMPNSAVTVTVTFKAKALDGTPATGSIDTVMVVSAVVALVAVAAIVMKRKVGNN